MGKKKRGCCGNFLWIFIAAAILSPIIGKNDPDNNSDQKEIIEETETEKPKTFTEQLSEYMDVSEAEEILRIYKEEIGFDTVEFDKQMDGTYNYYIWANGRHTIVTAVDGNYRIFIPYSDYVFYEDGQVVLTYADFEDSLIPDNELIYYYVMVQGIVESCLKSPQSADFPSVSEISYQKKGNLIAIKGYVDSKNAFNAEIRSNYLVQFYIYDLENFLYETTYIQIDGESVGTFVEF